MGDEEMEKNLEDIEVMEFFIMIFGDSENKKKEGKEDSDEVEVEEENIEELMEEDDDLDFNV